MPWYYIEVHSGGGHQSTTSKWTWRDTPVPIKTSTDIANFVDGDFDGEYFGGDSAIFHVKRVRKLPVETKQRMLTRYQTLCCRADSAAAAAPNPSELAQWKSMDRMGIVVRSITVDGHTVLMTGSVGAGVTGPGFGWTWRGGPTLDDLKDWDFAKLRAFAQDVVREYHSQRFLVPCLICHPPYHNVERKKK